MMTDSENAPLFIFNNPHSSLIMTRLLDQRKTGLFCDVILHVGSQIYAAHKNLLAASSLYFESLFLKESSRQKELGADIVIGPVHVTIDTVSVCPKMFCAVLDYMYLGHVSVEATFVPDVLVLADEFLLDSLKNYCFSYLECESKNISCLPDTTKNSEVLSVQQSISQCVKTVDYFQAIPTSTMPVLKLEISSENVEPKRDNTSKACDTKTEHKSKRRYPNRRSVKIIESEETIFVEPKVLGKIELDELIREPALSDNQTEILNLCGPEVVGNENTLLIESGCKTQARITRSTKKMTNRNSKIKLKLSKSVSASRVCVRLESAEKKNADEEFRSDLEIKDVKNDVDIDYNSSDVVDADYSPSESKKFRKVIKRTLLDDIKRKRGRPRKNAVFDEIFVIHQDETKFYCFWCDSKYKTKRDLAVHVAESHFSEPPYNCDRCGMTLNGVVELLKHKRSHSKLERSFECEICNMRFNKKVSLTQHLRSHTGERPYVCPVCGRSVTTKGGLDRHIISHTDHRPWLCHLCGFSTQYQSQLIQHRRVHNGNLFRCEMPNCKYAAKCRTHLKRHMRAHLNIRQHMCSRCPMAFVERNHLKRHEATHVGARPFKCDRCPYDCNRLDYLRAHQKRCGVTFNFSTADVGVD